MWPQDSIPVGRFAAASYLTSREGIRRERGTFGHPRGAPPSSWSEHKRRCGEDARACGKHQEARDDRGGSCRLGAERNRPCALPVVGMKFEEARHHMVTKMVMERTKKIAVIAHDNKKHDLLAWARFNKGLLAQHELFATETTGKLLEQQLALEVVKFRSGPLGGDQQIGAKIAEGEIDFLIFFWDPLEPHPHDPDVKALLRLAVVWNIPVACNRASADFMISSPLMDEAYPRLLPNYEERKRQV